MQNQKKSFKFFYFFLLTLNGIFFFFTHSKYFSHKTALKFRILEKKKKKVNQIIFQVVIRSILLQQLLLHPDVEYASDWKIPLKTEIPN